MKRILVTMALDAGDRDRVLHMAGGKALVDFVDPQQERAAYLAALAQAWALVGDPEPADLALCQNLAFMQTAWAGVERYVGCAFPRGAVLCNMSGAYGPVIADYMVGMILALCYHFRQYADNARRGLWQPGRGAKPLEGASALILGAGDIGTALARRLRPMAGPIAGIRRTPARAPDGFDRVGTLDELEAELPRADIIACCLPETPHTHHLLDGARLRLTKPDAVLVNVGRGGLIATDDLVGLLEAGHFWGVGLDVVSPEPLPSDHPLWKFDRVMITPHISGDFMGTDSPTRRRIRAMALDNLERYLRGEALENVVDFGLGY